MTPESQRVAIAEACGWFECGTSSIWYWGHKSLPEELWTVPTDKLPNYLEDLNAAHEFENTLTPKEQASYARRLAFHNRDDASVSHWIAAHASAAERAEQFLKIKGLWVDDRKPEPKISIATKPVDAQAGISLVIKEPPFPMNQNVN